MENLQCRRWREIAIGRWCLMTARSISGRCWLIVLDNTVLYDSGSIAGLVGAVLARAWRGIERWALEVRKALRPAVQRKSAVIGAGLEG